MWFVIGDGISRLAYSVQLCLYSDICLCCCVQDMSCRSKLATLNEKLTTLERRVEYIEARVSLKIAFGLYVSRRFRFFNHQSYNRKEFAFTPCVRKKETSYSCPNFHHILTDFKNSFTVTP